jgi:drug/metabolite transporter (DMT)-like permease
LAAVGSATNGTRWASLSASLRNSGAAGKASDPIAGVFWITLAMALMSGIAIFAKHLFRLGVAPEQVMFYRNLSVLLLLLPLFAWRGMSLVRTKNIKMYWLRSGIALFSMYAWFSALSLVPLGQITAISFLGPLFGTVFAALFLGEVLRARRITALGVGFLGAMVILRPGLEPIQLGHMLALVSAISHGIIGPLIKQLTTEDDADRVVFLSHVFMTPLTLIPAYFVWQWPTVELIPYLIGMGICAVLGHMSLARGFASADASLVFTFEFSRLPIAVGLAWIFFGEPTDVWTWVGAAIIFASAAYITRREAQLKKMRGKVLAREQTDPHCLTPLRMVPAE